MKNREDWKETVKKGQNKIEAWRVSCLSVEELLCLQLLGYSSKQLYEDMEGERYSLKETASMSIRELDKAKRILDRQAKAGVVTIPYYSEAYPHHFRHLREDAPPLIHVLGNKDLPNREDNVAIIGARAADKDGLDMAYGLAKQIWANKGISSSAVWLWDAIRLPIGVVLMRADRQSQWWPQA